MIENHIQAFMDIFIDNELKKKSKIYHYLRNLSITQQKILSSRIGEKKISYSIVFRYFLEKNKSKNVMLKLYGSTNISRTLFSNPAEPMVCPSSSNTPNRKKILVDEAWLDKKKAFWQQNNLLKDRCMSPVEMAKLLNETFEKKVKK